MALSPDNWHNRYARQAAWTRPLREYLLERVDLDSAGRVLEVGSGTGVVLEELGGKTRASLYGIDLDRSYLNLSRRYCVRGKVVQGDAHQLPYLKGSLDLVYCHFLLLWVSNPLSVVFEMARVTRPGGALLLLAEPDYGGRIDYPPDLEVLGAWQSEALRRQGAEPNMGRRLSELLHEAGLVNVETGVIGGQWSGVPSRQEWSSEWEVIESDLQQLTAANSASSADLQALKRLDWQSRQRGTRILFVPTFYAFGLKP